MTTFKLYGIWKCLLAQWLTDPCVTRRTNLTWLIVGLYLGQKVQASAIVKHWPIAVKVNSLTRRLSRFLDNAAIRPAVWFRPVARQLLGRASQHKVTIIVDASKVGAGHQLVIAALAYKKRALPLAWTWVAYAKGAVATETQLALFKRVRGLLPENAQVVLVGDAGFSSVLVLRQLEAWGWQYVLRQKGSYRLQRPGQSDWARLDGLVTAAGQQVWLAGVRFTAKWQHPTQVLAVWQAGYERPWLLTTNLTAARDARLAYGRRMWIEEMFGDWKGHGWDLETTHLRHPARLSRLVLALALLYIWLVLSGERLIKAGWRTWVDRSDRRDLSLFRIGLDVLQRCFTLDCGLPIPAPSLVGAASVR
ncbi:MAG: IS4 family transposase [Anaerolineales bacterium]